MIRKIIEINQDKCVGCGLCANACHESAIGMVDGKAKLLRDDYCDGLGNCLPVCPTGAISFVEREAEAYDKGAVLENQQKLENASVQLQGGCPGSRAKSLNRKENEEKAANELQKNTNISRLNQWPVQMQLVPISAPYFDNANLLIAADCSAYARGNFHEEFMKNKITIIGCPKLDDVDYSEKLTAIIKENNIKSVTVVRMEVPCCSGLENATITALKDSGKFIPWQVVTLSTEGEILDI